MDGIPLAIELAAARGKSLTVEQIAKRLHDQLELLTGGSRTALTRQQTLRLTLDWSYALLSGSDRKSMDTPMPPGKRNKYDQQVTQARLALSNAKFDAAWEEGHAMTLEPALVYALGEQISPRSQMQENPHL